MDPLPFTPGRCAVPGCLRRITTRMLMCREHWYEVPIDLRRRVWDGYSKGMGAEYRTAVLAAIDAVLAKQAGP